MLSTFLGSRRGSTVTGGDQGEVSNETYARKGLNARDKHLQNDELLSLYVHPAIVERMAQLLGPDLLLWRSQFFPKYPGMGGTGWRQATAYLSPGWSSSGSRRAAPARWPG